jgi:hypothetical protein
MVEAARPAGSAGLDAPARLGRAVWGPLTSVEFAVLQIIVLIVMACIGIVIRQLPSFALQAGPGSSDYTSQMAVIHDRYDPAFGAAVVDLLERLQVFRVFTSAWFSGAWSCSSSRSSCARSTGRRACDASRSTSGWPNPTATSIRPCPTGR